MSGILDGAPLIAVTGDLASKRLVAGRSNLQDIIYKHDCCLKLAKCKDSQVFSLSCFIAIKMVR